MTKLATAAGQQDVCPRERELGESAAMAARRTRVLSEFYKLSDFETRRNIAYTEAHYNLNGIAAILALLGNPQHSFQSIHIAGTKGKGTTAFYVQELLALRGLCLGLYTSPHVLELRERVAIGGVPVSWQVLLDAMEQILSLCGTAALSVTLFDVLTAAAFLCFREAGVNMAIVETGLGGRWDATNVLSPETLRATLFTRIDYDHMAKLGNTLRLIAIEKAEIMKAGVPAFYLAGTGTEQAAVAAVFCAKAAQLGVPVTAISGASPQAKRVRRAAAALSAMQPERWLPRVFQENCALALAAVETSEAYSFKQEELISVLARPLPMGRYTHFANIVIDCAHTPLSLKQFIAELQRAPFFKSAQAVTFGFYAYFDKQVEALTELIPLAWDFVFCHIELPFIGAEQRLAVCKRVRQTRVAMGGTMREVTALQELNIAAQPERLFVFCGSFRLVAAVLSVYGELDVKAALAGDV